MIISHKQLTLGTIPLSFLIPLMRFLYVLFLCWLNLIWAFVKRVLILSMLNGQILLLITWFHLHYSEHFLVNEPSFQPMFVFMFQDFFSSDGRAIYIKLYKCFTIILYDNVIFNENTLMIKFWSFRICNILFPYGLFHKKVFCYLLLCTSFL